jgi:abortive infection bacteriophage resistance protein
MLLKNSLSIQNQISLLRERGMKIYDEDEAVAFLNQNQYYRLNIYFHKLMDPKDHFKENVTFSHIIEIHRNDKWLRKEIFSLLEIVEINMRARISYHLAMKDGSDAFYKEGLCKNSRNFKLIQKSFLNQVSRNSKDPVVIHHQNKYEGRFPIWVVVEFFSFNTLSKYFANLLEVDKKEIAKAAYGLNEYLLGQWLHVLSVLRNVCAHFGYLYKRDFPIRPKIAKSFNWENGKDSQLFAQLLVIRRLSGIAEWDYFTQQLLKKLSTTEFFPLEAYGFPENWEEYLIF